MTNPPSQNKEVAERIDESGALNETSGVSAPGFRYAAETFGPDPGRNGARLRFIKAFLLLSLGTTLLIGVWWYQEYRSQMDRIETTSLLNVSIANLSIEKNLSNVVSDLAFLSGQQDFRDFLETGADASRKAVEDDWLLFAASRSAYDQIRYLKSDGAEGIRVNFNGGSPSAVHLDKLQQKQTRYYFQEAIRLDPGQIYVSPFDLNVEEERVEMPPRPMLRIGTPVLDREGRKRGIVILNYLGATLLENIKGMWSDSGGKPMLLNSEGYWAVGIKPEDEWGFMFDDRKDRSFAHDFPAAWSRIAESRSGQFYGPDGLFTFTTESRWAKAAQRIGST